MRSSLGLSARPPRTSSCARERKSAGKPSRPTRAVLARWLISQSTRRRNQYSAGRLSAPTGDDRFVRRRVGGDPDPDRTGRQRRGLRAQPFIPPREYAAGRARSVRSRVRRGEANRIFRSRSSHGAFVRCWPDNQALLKPITDWPSCWKRRASGRKLIAITSLPETVTVFQCVASPPFSRFTVKSPRAMTAS